MKISNLYIYYIIIYIYLKIKSEIFQTEEIKHKETEEFDKVSFTKNNK